MHPIEDPAAPRRSGAGRARRSPAEEITHGGGRNEKDIVQKVGATVAGVEDIAGGAQVTMDLTFEVDGQEKPACVAEALYRWLL